MKKGDRGRLILTLVSTQYKPIKQGLYVRDFFTYDFVSDEGEKFHYGGSIKAIFIGKRYEVIATCDGFRYGATQLKCPKFQPEGAPENALFERA